ncbi:hypothetical protein [Bradyrhizobium icense]|uniref:Aspartate/glutamate racemase family protein n=1 Tax=Bradyrhizobium icense TaxID=1274631 RepID=A0A1B1UJQ1_9BRAD|nr:hypothetical protein [Bradyrhizobium icense]ANW02986.1 hypothetical protein LMTR13_25350 [Bradyrhizobium icense]
MTTSFSQPLGILLLDRALPPDAAPLTLPIGSMRNPATFGFPTISETVAGAYGDDVIRGNPALELAYIAAARRLVERGAVAISSNCGFTIRYQAAVAASVKVPVVMSSLLLVPALLCQLPVAAKLAVLTFDSTHCGEDLLGVNHLAGRARVVIGGLEGGKLWRNEMRRTPLPTDLADIEEEVAACVARLRAVHPEIAAILFECTVFPLVAPAIRRITGLPVYDITTLCRMTFASVAPERTMV